MAVSYKFFYEVPSKLVYIVRTTCLFHSVLIGNVSHPAGSLSVAKNREVEGEEFYFIQTESVRRDEGYLLMVS